MKALEGRVAVVAGATRGAGRGIARALGEAGAVVYCTGRSVPGQPSPYARPETIDETAALITAAGGTAIPVRVDHTVEREVEGLFARVAARAGPPGRARQQHRRRRPADERMGLVLGGRPGQGRRDPAPGDAVARHHRQIRGPADGPRAAGPARRGHRERHPDGRQRQRAGADRQARAQGPGRDLRHGAAAARRGRGGDHAGVPPLREHAGSLRRHRSELEGGREEGQQLPRIGVAALRRAGGGGAGAATRT